MAAQSNETTEIIALSRLDEACVKLQKQGNYLEALGTLNDWIHFGHLSVETMERGLVLRQHFYGADSEQVWSACKTIGEMW